MHKTLFGLIGYPLNHSFSQRYFKQKFASWGVENYDYQLFELKNIEEILTLIDEFPLLQGLNITSPFKQSVIPFLDHINPVAKEINSVNTIAIENGKLIGYNTDYLGFKYSFEKNINKDFRIKKVAILGTGGAAQSVAYTLRIISIPFFFVSRQKESDNIISYNTLNNSDFNDISVFINTTPCGMLSVEQSLPNIDINKINHRHIVFDLIYNPSPTPLLSLSKRQGAKTIDGLQMLYSQAEYSWQIWNK